MLDLVAPTTDSGRLQQLQCVFNCRNPNFGEELETLFLIFRKELQERRTIIQKLERPPSYQLWSVLGNTGGDVAPRELGQ